MKFRPAFSEVRPVPVHPSPLGAPHGHSQDNGSSGSGPDEISAQPPGFLDVQEVDSKRDVGIHWIGLMGKLWENDDKIVSC